MDILKCCVEWFYKIYTNNICVATECYYFYAINNTSDVLIFIYSGLHNIYFIFFNHNLWHRSHLWKISEVNAKCNEYITLLPVVNELIVLMLWVENQRMKWSVIISITIMYILLKVFSGKC